jgi:hypothetical protein
MERGEKMTALTGKSEKILVIVVFDKAPPGVWVTICQGEYLSTKIS